MVTIAAGDNAVLEVNVNLALSSTNQLGVVCMPFVIKLMISASCAYIESTGFQGNHMMWGNDEYHFNDFIQIGSAMTLIVAVMGTFLTLIVFRF